MQSYSSVVASGKCNENGPTSPSSALPKASYAQAASCPPQYQIEWLHEFLAKNGGIMPKFSFDGILVAKK